MKNKGGCLGCAHYVIDAACWYSEDTYDDMEVRCGKGLWSSYNVEDQKQAYDYIIVRGGDCDQYEKADHVK